MCLVWLLAILVCLLGCCLWFGYCVLGVLLSLLGFFIGVLFDGVTCG